MSVHHCGCVVLCFINIRQKGRFWAASLASGSSMPNEDRFLQTIWIQVERSLPGGLLQLSGGCATEFDSNSFIRATCPNRESRQDLTTEEGGGCWVIRRTASFLTKSLWYRGINNWSARILLMLMAAKVVWCAVKQYESFTLQFSCYQIVTKRCYDFWKKSQRSPSLQTRLKLNFWTLQFPHLWLIRLKR